MLIQIFFVSLQCQNKTITTMEFEVKVKVAPILNHFYEVNNVRSHEERMYREGGTRHKTIVDAYKRGRNALVEYVENTSKPLSEITKEEMMEVFENGMEAPFEKTCSGIEIKELAKAKLSFIMDFSDADSIVEAIGDDLVEDVIETADVEYNDSDVEISLARVLKEKLGINK